MTLERLVAREVVGLETAGKGGATCAVDVAEVGAAGGAVEAGGASGAAGAVGFVVVLATKLRDV